MKKVILSIILMLVSQVTFAEVSTMELEKYLPGTWNVIQEISGDRIESKTTYKKDGTVTYDIKVTSSDGKSEFSAEGKWKIDGIQVVVTITKSSSPDFMKVGEVIKDSATFIDAKQFSYVDEDGTAVTEYKD